MAGAPWILLALGIVVVIIGFFVTAMGRGSGRDFIDPRMSDKEIARRMKNQEAGGLVGAIIMALGFLMVLVSVVWRIVRIFV
jgi:hypothetical protein